VLLCQNLSAIRVIRSRLGSCSRPQSQHSQLVGLPTYPHHRFQWQELSSTQCRLQPSIRLPSSHVSSTTSQRQLQINFWRHCLMAADQRLAEWSRNWDKRWTPDMRHIGRNQELSLSDHNLSWTLSSSSLLKEVAKTAQFGPSRRRKESRIAYIAVLSGLLLCNSYVYTQNAHSRNDLKHRTAAFAARRRSVFCMPLAIRVDSLGDAWLAYEIRRPNSWPTAVPTMVNMCDAVSHFRFPSSYYNLVSYAIGPLVVLSVCLSVCDVGVLWPNGWIDQDETWYWGRPWPRPHCLRWGSSSPSRNGHSPQFSAHVCCGQIFGLFKMPLGTKATLC